MNYQLDYFLPSSGHIQTLGLFLYPLALLMSVSFYLFGQALQ